MSLHEIETGIYLDFNGNDSFTKLLLHMNGSDGSTTFTDSSAAAKTMTANGNVQIDTAQSKFGGASGLFDGSGDYLSTTSTIADFDFSTGNFTVDFWCRANSLSGSGHNGLITLYNTGTTTGGFRIETDVSGGQKFNTYVRYTDATESSAYTTTILTTNTWYHYALVRSGNNFYVFVNGTQEATWSSSKTLQAAGGSLVIGRLYVDVNNFYWDGWIDELRISKGIARWTSNFTPPTSAYG